MILYKGKLRAICIAVVLIGSKSFAGEEIQGNFRLSCAPMVRGAVGNGTYIKAPEVLIVEKNGENYIFSMKGIQRSLANGFQTLFDDGEKVQEFQFQVPQKNCYSFKSNKQRPELPLIRCANDDHRPMKIEMFEVKRDPIFEGKKDKIQNPLQIKPTGKVRTYEVTEILTRKIFPLGTALPNAYGVIVKFAEFNKEKNVEFSNEGFDLLSKTCSMESLK